MNIEFIGYEAPSGLYTRDGKYIGWEELLASEKIEVLGNELKSVSTGISGMLVVDGSIAEIGKSAFEYCKELTGLIVSKGVRVLNWSALKGCESLKQIGVTAITTRIEFEGA